MPVKTTTTPDLTALEARADALEEAAGRLEGRWERHLRDASRAWRDGVKDAASRNYSRQGRWCQGGTTYAMPGAPGASGGYVKNPPNPATRIDGRDKILADYREDYLTWAAGREELGFPAPPMPAPPETMVADLELAALARVRAAADRRIIQVLSGDDGFSVDPEDREVAESQLVQAIVEGQELVHAIESVGVDVAPPTPPDDRRPVVIYCRVSTREQGDSQLGLDAQEEACRRECDRRDWRVVEVVREVVSGERADRPLFSKAIGAARHHRGILLAAKADRLSRGGPMKVLPLFEQAGREGWSVYALDLPEIDTTTGMGEFVLTIIAAVNRLERRMIGERTRAALRQAQARGVKVGRPDALDPRARASRPEDTARMERALPRLRALRLEGLSYRRIAAALNEEGVASVEGGRWHDRSVRLALLRYGTTDAQEGEAA